MNPALGKFIDETAQTNPREGQLLALSRTGRSYENDPAALAAAVPAQGAAFETASDAPCRSTQLPDPTPALAELEGAAEDGAANLGFRPEALTRAGGSRTKN
jgi:hypothetical protein